MVNSCIGIWIKKGSAKSRFKILKMVFLLNFFLKKKDQQLLIRLNIVYISNLFTTNKTKIVLILIVFSIKKYIIDFNITLMIY